LAHGGGEGPGREEGGHSGGGWLWCILLAINLAGAVACFNPQLSSLSGVCGR
jgi:hypothetical protein